MSPEASRSFVVRQRALEREEGWIRGGRREWRDRRKMEGLGRQDGGKH